MRVTQCRAETCKADIIFVGNTHGARQVLNAEPDPNGNVIVENEIARTLTKEEKAGLNWHDPLIAGSVYMPHHATCPAVKDFRKKVKR